jgi:hypothetical protein
MDSELIFGLFWDPSKEAWAYGSSDGYIQFIDTSVNSTEQVDANCDASLNSLASSMDKRHLALGTNGEVILRRFPNIVDSVKTVCRSTLPVRDLTFSHCSRYLIVAGEDPNVTIFSVDDNEKVETIETNSVGVRAVSISPKDDHLAVMDMDGNLSMFDVSPISMKKDKQVSVHKAIISKEVSRGVQNHHYKMAWLENALFVPGRSGVINVLTREGAHSWKESPLMGDPSSALSHKSNNVTLVEESPNGAFVASADASGRIVIWKIDCSDPTKSVPIRCFEENDPVMSLKWGFGMSDNYLMILKKDTFHQLANVVPTEFGSPAEPVVRASVINDISDDALFAGVTDEMLMQVAPTKTNINTGDSEDEEFTETIGKEKRKRLQKTVETKDEDDEDKQLLEQQEAAPVSSFKRTPLFSGEEAPKKVKDMFNEEAVKVSDKQLLREALQEEEDLDGDDDDLDDDSIVVDKIAAPKKFSGNVMDIAKALEQSGALSSILATKLQPAFQPASTRADEKNRRYLVWNSVGNITSREEAHENRIEIRFTDASRGNRNEAFPDRNGFVMGALGYDAAAFATSADEPPQDELYNRDMMDGENPNPLKNCKGSTLLYHAFPGAHHLDGVNESFLITLSEGEEVKALAVGTGFVAAATSRKLLRIFSSTGLEISVISLPGPVVCMVSLNDTLAIIFHVGNPFDDTFAMAVHLYRINWRHGYTMDQILNHMHVPLSRKSTLEWVGFDVDNTSLLVLDSCGIMSTLMYTAGYQWTPVFNIMQVRKTIDHRYWPIMVKNNKLVYVLLNGESKPAIYPQPVVSTKSLRVAIAVHRDGADFSETTKEKMNALLFEKMKVENFQHEVQRLVGKPEYLEELQMMEAALEAQQLASDKVVLVSFQEACASQHIALALSLGIRLKSTKSLMAGIKIANHFGRVTVAEALDGMMQHRAALELYQQQLQYAASGVVMDQQEQNDPLDYDDHYEQQNVDSETTTGGLLSRKASLKQQGRQLSSNEPIKKVVSPDPNNDTKRVDSSKPLNPFAVNKTGQTPQKRPASVLENLESPSPKKPVLNRQSTFSQNARKQHFSNKHIL